MLKKFVVVVACIILFGGMWVTGKAAVYSCKDSSGRVSYQDLPCATSEEQLEISQEGESSGEPLCGKTSTHSLSALDVVYFSEKHSVLNKADGRQNGQSIHLKTLRQEESYLGMLRGIAVGGRGSDVKAYQDRKGVIHICLASDGSRAAQEIILYLNGQLDIYHKQGSAYQLVKKMHEISDPVAVSERCTDAVTTCFRPDKPGHSLDECMQRITTCSQSLISQGTACCPASCKAAYRKQRAQGVEPLDGFQSIFYGGSHCVPGIDKTLSGQ